jgi:hypothetical protein
MSNPPQQPEWKPGQPPPWDQPAQPAQPPQPPEGQWVPGQPPPAVPWTAMPQQPPPPKKSLLSRFMPLIVLGVIIAVAGGGVYLFRDQLTGNVTELRAGDCFDEPAGASIGTEIKDIQHRPCTQPHDAEVFFVVNHPAANDAAYPTPGEREQFVAERCLPAFQSYTGRSFDSAVELDLAWYYPTTNGWSRNNDREFTCYTKNVDGAKLSSSVKGAAPSQ